MDKKTADIWVKVYAILTWIGIFAMIFFGILLIASGPMIQNIAASLESEISTELIAGTALAMGIVLLIFSVFFIFFALALWKHKEWSRIVAIIFSVFAIFSGIVSLFTVTELLTISGLIYSSWIVSLFTVTGLLTIAVIVGLLLDCWFFYVFAFDKGTKELFMKKK